MLPERRLSEFVSTLEYSMLPDGSADTVRRAFLDTVGVTLAGAVDGAGGAVGTSSAVETDGADGGALLGVTSQEAPAAAALRVGTASHALDYDDLSWAVDGHPSVAIVPPLLALAEEADASGRDLVTAYVAGFEVAAAVADPVSPDHYEAGWHATSTFGTFGAAAAAAHLLGLDTDGTERALNMAASMPAGTKQNFGSMTKPLHAGLCARSGVTAALLARDGLTAGSEAISGEQGFWDLYDPADRPAATKREAFAIGEEWAIDTEGIHVKAYPCCYFTHTSIAATQTLLAAGVDPDAVERIEVRAAGGAGDALTNPDPETGLEAKFSMEHAVACALVRDRVGLAEFEDDATDDPNLVAARNLVDFAVDESIPYDSHEATVRIVTATDTHERHQENPPGVHENPLPEDEFRAKFEACGRRALPGEEVATLYDRLSSLTDIPDVAAALDVR